MPNYFIFDINKCVGCHACMVACYNENKTSPPLNWRHINTFNPQSQPGLPVFYHSLACNHCREAPCLKNCPANAYSRDPETGAVIHHPDKCIGCRYCTWTCPYDAPQFNPQKHIVEKCTFCNERIKKGLKPACAELCPVGALDFEFSDNQPDNADIQAFTDRNTQPLIKFIAPRKKNQKPEIVPTPIFDIESKSYDMEQIKPPSKITFKKEWLLMLFTLLAAFLTGIFSASQFVNIEINPWGFVGIGIAGMGLSLFHLGKKFRAYRAIINQRHSWLSREILFYSLFIGSSGIYFFYQPFQWLGWLCAVFGFLSLISIDRVYYMARKNTPFTLHSAHVFLTGLFFMALFAKNLPFIFLIGITKLSLYVYRKYYFYKKNRNIKMFLSAFRLDCLLSIPLILWLIEISDLFWWSLVSIIIGEMIDRSEYYEELDIITPEKEMWEEMKKLKENQK